MLEETVFDTPVIIRKRHQESLGLLDGGGGENGADTRERGEEEEADNSEESSEANDTPWHTRLLRGMVTGVGFLSDAYDLFVINGVILIISDYEKSVADYKSGIATSVLVGAVLGQLGFGIVADKIGRRLGFILTLALVITGSIASSLSFAAGSLNVFQCLMFWRFLLGVGVGGEYPLSATISAETSSTHKRGKNTALVFSMQGVGSLLATVASLLFFVVFERNVAWRVALAFGAVPGLLMFYYRLKMEETSRFSASKQPTPVPLSSLTVQAPPQQEVTYLLTQDPSVADSTFTRAFSGLREYVDKVLKNPKVKLVLQNWKRLLGTAGSWFLLDITFYANGLFSTTILKVAGVQEDLKSILTWNIYLALVALPGYWVAVFLIERVGRKRLQLFGFILLGATYFIMGIFHDSIVESAALFFMMYSLTFFITNMGPNTTTYVLPSESFPTEIRATCHGISAAAGKLGAVVGSAMMTPLLDAHGLPTVLIICAIVAFIGAVHTFFFTVETLGKTLEQINSPNKPS